MKKKWINKLWIFSLLIGAVGLLAFFTLKQKILAEDEKPQQERVYFGKSQDQKITHISAEKGYEYVLNLYIEESEAMPLVIQLESGTMFEATTTQILNEGSDVGFTYDSISNEVRVDASKMSRNVSKETEQKKIKLAISTLADFTKEQSTVRVFDKRQQTLLATLTLDFRKVKPLRALDPAVMDVTSTMGAPKMKPTNINMVNGGFEYPGFTDGEWNSLSAIQSALGTQNLPWVTEFPHLGMYKVYVTHDSPYYGANKIGWKVQVKDPGSGTIDPLRAKSIEFMKDMSIIYPIDDYLDRPIPAPEGRQFVELNAEYFTKLYQIIPTTPGILTRWSLYHTGQKAGVGNGDTLGVEFGPDQDTTNYLEKKYTDDLEWTSGQPGNWTFYRGSYLIPERQVTTSFGFYAEASWGGRMVTGNYLDDVRFTNPSFIELEKKVDGFEQSTGDSTSTFNYVISATNTGETASDSLLITDELPAGLELVQSSLPMGASYDVATRMVSFDHPYKMAIGESKDFSFQVKLTDQYVYENSKKNKRIDNGAKATWQDEGYTDVTYTNYSDIATIIPENIEPEVTITKQVDKAKVRVGDELSYTLTVKNDAEAPLSAAWFGQLTDKLPVALDQQTELTEYVAGSAEIDATGTGTAYTELEDSAVWDAGTKKLTFSALEVQGQSRILLRFRVRVLPPPIADTVILNQAKEASGYYGSQITYEPEDSNTVQTTIDFVGSIKVTKTDDLGELLQGATYVVKDASDTQVGTGTTDSKGTWLLTGLSVGTYTITETAAPLGHDLGDPQARTVTVTRDGTAEVTFVNERQGKITVKKVDKTTQGVLAGASYTIEDSNGVQVDTGTTDSTGLFTSNYLSAGTYNITETAAPINYELATQATQTVTVSKGAIAPVIFENERQVGGLKIIKSDSENAEKKLAGALFDIAEDSSGSTLLYTNLATSMTGEINVPMLATGTYYVREKQAPDGYRINKTDWEPVTIERGKTTEYLVKNSPLRLHVRQVVLNPLDTLVVPTTGYFQLRQPVNDETSRKSYQLLTGSTTKDQAADISKELFASTRILAKADPLSINVSVPEYYSYCGGIVTKDETNLGFEHSSDNSTEWLNELPLIVDYGQSSEYWVTVFITPKMGTTSTGDLEKDPRPYSWDYKTNELGTIQIDE